jgi:hypothetical protein
MDIDQQEISRNLLLAAGWQESDYHRFLRKSLIETQIKTVTKTTNMKIQSA